MKEKTIKISSWKELTKFVENMNPYKETILLSGFVNRMYIDQTIIQDLYFTTKPVEILKKNEETNKKTNKSTRKKRSK